jgi:hypothetical protein
MTRTLAVGASFLAVAFVSAEQGRFASRADLVTVYASVRSRGEPVWTLERGDFEVLVDGKQRDIVHFAREAQPLKVAIVLDRSGSYLISRLWGDAASVPAWVSAGGVRRQVSPPARPGAASRCGGACAGGISCRAVVSPEP